MLLAIFSFNYMRPLPPSMVDPYMNGAFPDIAPGNELYEITDVMPDVFLQSPLRIIEFPSPNELLVLNKQGEVHLLNRDEQTKNLVLDISSKTFKLGDGGSVGLAIHPDFFLDQNKQWVFVYYRTTPMPDNWSSPGYNRLSKFKWDETLQHFDPESEEILIQQYDRSPWHNGGDMVFDEEGFLYLSLGDEGYDEFQMISTQRINGGFFGGIIKIDVDNDPERSHPIKRQPQSLATPINNWAEGSFSQGYSIPNDNPWVNDSEDVLEEFYSIGLRSPYNIYYDEETQEIWAADVGTDLFEEVDRVMKGDNHQWPYMEGDAASENHDRPDSLIGNEKGVVFQYPRSSGLGSCIIGGFIYKGDQFSSLRNNYVFADFTSNKIVALDGLNSSTAPIHKVLVNDIKSLFPNLAEKTKVVAIDALSNGEILFCMMGEDHESEGKILKLKRTNEEVQEPPRKLSDIGFFKDLASFEVHDAAIEYTVNAPLWSDGALKKRWVVLANDGQFDSELEQVKFSPEGKWRFPSGTVFVKHFDMQLDLSDAQSIDRLETRFFIIDKNQVGYGLTYKWNDEETEAFLVESELVEELGMIDENGDDFILEWSYPSKDQCLNCHNSSANYVLGLSTHQLNGSLFYKDIMREDNQLNYWSELNLFDTQIGVPNGYNKSVKLSEEGYSLDLKIMSYLDANCASCHNDKTNLEVDLDFRFQETIHLRRYIDANTQSHASSNSPIIKAGDHQDSELWIRDAQRGKNQMPPLATKIIDGIYVDSLAKWIDNLPERPLDSYHDLLVYPNPTEGLVCVQVSDQISLPAKLQLWSMTGRLIQEQSIQEKLNFIDLAHLSKGNYNLVVKEGESLFEQRIIKI